VANLRPKKKFLRPNLELKISDFSIFWVYLLSFSVYCGPKSQYFLQIFQVAAHRPVWVGHPWTKISFFSRSTSNGRLSAGNPKRLKYYNWIAYLLPIITPIIFFVTCYFSDNMEFFLQSLGAVSEQRLVHYFHFAEESESFYKTFGLFEIIIKSITLSFFVGTLFYFWKSDQELRSLDVGVHRPAESNWNK
jgi:hypothetical protein